MGGFILLVFFPCVPEAGKLISVLGSWRDEVGGGALGISLSAEEVNW